MEDLQLQIFIFLVAFFTVFFVYMSISSRGYSRLVRFRRKQIPAEGGGHSEEDV
jgi:hypothetical protein